MGFSQLTPSLLDPWFVGVLAAVALVRPLWPASQHDLLLAISSIILIGVAAPPTMIVISVLTLLLLYPLHRAMRRTADEKTEKATPRRWLMFFGVGTLVLLLILFKVQRHFDLHAITGSWQKGDLIVLIGFSYFIFKAISFLHIQSILPIDERKPWALLSYTLFPPTLTSGPIQKFQDFRAQIAAPAPLTGALARDAGYRITRGYFRKAVVAFVCNEGTAKLLAAPHLTVLTSAALVILLYLYFYFDFAGYSDIAIGFGLLMGIKVPENFRKPFVATNVSEFWRNWHITLVDWFRDNVFIPLGGMQSSRLWAATLAMLVMMLCGLWHGLTIALFAWGCWHGFWLFVEGVSGSRPVPPSLRHGIGYWSRVLWTNARVALASVLFLPTSDAMIKVFAGFTRWA
jgi:alginate O-acetyltransferase complex protein AlgI